MWCFLDLVPIVQIKNREKNPWRSDTFSITPKWDFFMFFKLKKLYQIVQSLTYIPTTNALPITCFLYLQNDL